MIVWFLIALAAGCLKPGVPEGFGLVEGTVTLDKEPLGGALLEFTPPSGKPSYGTTDEQGHYEMTYARNTMGVQAGPCQVAITMLSEDAGQGAPESLPARYNEQSTLTATVQEGKVNTIDWHLESDPSDQPPPTGEERESSP